jgi:2-methylcitrate dehydratase PrpD
LEGKVSLGYAVVATLLDGFPDRATFTDAAVARPQVRALLERFAVEAEPGGADVLAGQARVRVEHRNGSVAETVLDLPDGHPRRPLSESDLTAKVGGCVGPARAGEVLGLDWDGAAALLLRMLPGG